jgi:hypothetical protein
MSSNTLMPASISPKPSVKFKPVMNPPLKSRVRYLSSFKGALFLNFNKALYRALLLMAVQQSEESFSIAGKKLRV